MWDVIIIGSGVVGCSIANSLSRDGLNTLNVDALPAPGYGSTSYSSAIIRPLYNNIDEVALAHESRLRWLNWREFLEAPQDETIASYTESGMLVLLFDDQAQHAPSLKAMNQAGVPYELWGPDKVRDALPSMSMISYAPPRRIDDDAFGSANGKHLSGAIHVPAAGYVNDPQLAAQNLFSAARRRGATFKFNAAVEEIVSSTDQFDLKLSSGDKVAAPMVINAAGPHSAKVNALVGLAAMSPGMTAPMRQEVAYVPRPSNGTELPVVLDLDQGTYYRGDGANLLVGSADPDCDDREFVDPDRYQDGFSDQWTNQAWRAGLRFESIQIPNQAKGVVSLYDMTSDWIPVVDKTDLENYFVAIGTSGNQFKNAPTLGDMVSKLVFASKNGIDTDQENIRLDLHALEASVDISHFSRRRPALGEELA